MSAEDPKAGTELPALTNGRNARRPPAYFRAGRAIGVTPSCSSAVYGDP
jgi:hypothetical protein